jgi:hypothetical protein
MDQQTAVKIFEKAKAYSEENYADELEWANSIDAKTFRNLRSKRFLTDFHVMLLM